MRSFLSVGMVFLLMAGISACSGGDSAQEEDPAPASSGKDERSSAKADGSPAESNLALTSLEDQTVGVACGVCIYSMEGEGCPIAADVNGEKFMVTFADGLEFDTHGKGLCSADGKAKVSGAVKDGKLELTSLELFTD